ALFKRHRIVAIITLAAAPAVYAGTPVIVSGLSGFEGREEPAVIYFPDTNTFVDDSYVNMIDEGGGMIRSTLPNDYTAAGGRDGDRQTTTTDREGGEVKGSPGLGHKKVGDTFEYSFDFRTDPTLRGTALFCHVFQLKGTDGKEGPPLVTVSLYRNGSA